jgi:putative flavoprotein involved in K+ transport
MNDVHGWLEAFDQALGSGDSEAIAALFLAEGFWRDHVAFGWTLATHEGGAAIAAFAADRALATGASGWKSEAPAGASEGYISFETALGRGKGYLRLVGDKALTLYTALVELKGFEEPLGTRRPSGMAGDPEGRGRSWKQLLGDETASYAAGKNPYVLVIGAGQSGLAIGARLRMLSVPCLLVDKYPRIGDQWRSRYDSLTLHDPVWYDHMPYVPYPSHWPVYSPKDKVGDWLEYYAGIMELPVWNSTECVRAAYDSARARWDVTLRRETEDGSREHVLHPDHLIMAVGNAGFAKMPQIPDQQDFKGTLRHSSAHPGGAEFSGKRVIVIGANNSAHDIAADLVIHGAEPVMIQRSSTHIVRQTTMTDVMLKPLYSQEAVDSGMTTERADMMVASVPLRLSEAGARATWNALQVSEAPFYESLTKAGFAIDFGEDGTGIAMNFLRTSSGYYLDVGACDMVIDGRIAVRSGLAIDRLVEDGLILSDGSHERADAIICATGFGTMAEWVSRLISPEVADQVGPCWGYGSGVRGDPGPWEGEIRNMWKPTAVPGLWFMGGNFALGRYYSRLLALQLKARYEGLPVEPYAA